MEVSLLTVLLVGAVSAATPGLAKDLCLVGDFDQQADELLDYIRLPPEGYRNLAQVTADIERVLRTQWPGTKVMPYGSTVTGLALKSSDIDCYIDIPAEEKGDSQTLVNVTLGILKKYPELFEDFETTLAARVPLLTCVHVPQHIFVDFTFSGPFSVNSSLMLSHLLHLDQRGLDLATIVKYWGSVHNIANGKLTLPSYAIVLMTLFYLQQKNIVPSVAALQKHATPYIMEHWNNAYEPTQFHTDNNETLYELLGGFFKYYSDFDFENTIISPYIGKPITRQQFENLDDLDNFSLYKHNLANGLVMPYRFGHLNIQDPLKHSENTARPNSDRWLADRLIKHLKASAMMYDVLGSEQFLTAVLIPEQRIEEGMLKTYWSGGVASAEECQHQLWRRIR